MKTLFLSFLIALTAAVSSNAQTLQVDPIHVGGTANFEVQNATPGAIAIVCYSTSGTGPFTLANGLTFDLSMPIRQLPPMVIDSLGSGQLGPFPVPSSAVVGMQLWFQAVHLDFWANPALTTTNMVPITVQHDLNNAPVALNDNARVAKSGVALIDVLANDSDPDGDAISIVSVSTPTSGTTLIVSGQVEYTPLVNYLGADSFTYVIEDSSGAQATGAVSVDVVNSGSLVSWGSDVEWQITNTPSGNDFTQVAGGHGHSVALRVDGSLVSWGRDVHGQVMDTPSGNDFTEIAVGFEHGIALRSDGSLVSWGSDLDGQVTDTPVGNDFTQVSGGGWYSVALRADGSLVSWGNDWAAVITDTPTSNDFTQVSGGGQHSVALRSNGSLVSWGDNQHSQVTNTPSGNDFTQVAGGHGHSVALRVDGSLASWGQDADSEVTDTPSGNDFTQVAGGGASSVALRADGSLVSWGWNSHGQVTDTPVSNDFIQVTAGYYHSVGIKN